MSLVLRRKVLYWVAVAAIALMLAGTTLATPVFADCTTSSSPTCTG